MNLKFPKLNTNLIIILSALAVLILFYIFYLQFYVKVKENRVVSTRFRVLDQMGKNVDQRLTSFKNNARDLNNKVKGEWIQAKGNDTVYISNKVLSKLIDRLNTRGDINKNLKVVSIFKAEDRDSIAKRYGRSLKQYKFEVEINNLPDIVHTGGSEWFMLLETDYSSLLKGLQREDVFDNLLLIKDTMVVFNTLNQEIILDPAESERLDLDKNASGNGLLDSFPFNMGLTPIGKLTSGEVFDLTLSSKMHKAFLKPIEVNQETWYVIGLMEKSRFQATIRSIESWIIILLSLILILIILGMPSIKLLLMTSTEQLSTSTLISFALSIILGGIILVLMLILTSQDILHRQQTNHRLKKLSNDIYTAFTGELNAAYGQMEQYDANKDLMDFDDPDNYFNTSIVKDILNKKAPHYPGLYPFGDYYFWVDGNGMQTAYMTPNDQFGKLSNLSRRDYVNKKDEWFLPGTEDRKFRIESIVSVTSGTVKAAISKKGMREENPVVAISSRFYSIVNTILPRDYTFAIIDNDGLVWFHSNEYRNLKENFISECNDDPYLKGLMYSRIPKSISVNYYNSPHRIYVRPIGKLPLYLITIYNKKSEQSFQAQVITLSLAMVGFLLLMLFTQIIALLIIERRFRLTLTRNFTMKLTRPILRLNGRYEYLIKLYTLVIILITPFLIWFQAMHAVAAIFTMTIIVVTYSYWILNDNEFKQPHRKWIGIVNLLLLILVNIIAFIIISNEDAWKLLLFEGFLVLIIFVCDRFFDKERKNVGDKYWKNYVLLLVMLLILLGILPALKFYELAYNTESKIRAMHSLTEFSQKRENRNMDVRSIYKSTVFTDKVRDVFEKRRNLGIYNSFLGMDFGQKCRPTEEFVRIQENSYWDTIIGYFRPFYDDYIKENKYLILTKVSSQDLKWYEYGNQLTLEYQSRTEDPSGDTLRPFYATTSIPRLTLYTPFFDEPLKTGQIWWLNALFWIFLVGLVLVFQRILRFGTFRFFGYDIIQNYRYQKFDQLVEQQMLANKDIMVCRQSPRDDTTHFKNSFLEDQETLVIDWNIYQNVGSAADQTDRFIAKQKKNSPDNKPVTVFIDNFASNFEDPKIFAEKLQVVRLFMNRYDIKLILFTAFTPETIIQHYREIIKDFEAEKEKSKRASFKVDQYHELLQEFQQLRQSFIVDMLPVRHQISPQVQEAYCHDQPRIISMEEMIKKELHASDYLHKYEIAITDFCRNECMDEGVNNPELLLIKKINSLAEDYFEELFNNCSAEEKYVLLDLAFDQIMNPNNEKAIFSLLNKGLLVRKCYKINFMNISFRRFVMSKFSKEAKRQLETQMGKEAGTWKGFRATLIIVIIGLFVFIGLANQDMLDNLNELFVALGGGIAVITGVLGILSKKDPTTDD